MASKRLAQQFLVSKRLMSEVSDASIRYISPTSALGQLSHKVSRFEQRLLVWSGRFRNTSEVPAHVTRETMERARNHFRIRLNLAIAAATAIGSMMMVISGKSAIHRGENITQYNLDWHRRYNEAHAADFHSPAYYH